MEPFNVFDPAFRADPYLVYAHYRAGDPVHRGHAPTPNGPGEWWYLFRHADISAVLADPRFGRAIAPALDEPPPPVPAAEREPFWDMYARWTLALEPPEHTWQRTRLSGGFTPRVVAALRPAIAAQAGALLDQLGPRGRFDVVVDYAYPLTLSIIAALIGIPRCDLDRVKAWSLIIADVLDYKRTWDVMAAGNRMTQEFTAFLAQILDARRARPQNDLITRLSAAVDGQGKLDDDDVVALCVMLLFAGHETTVSLISAGTMLLATHPEQLALFHARPEVTATTVEEILRLHSPIQATTRIAYTDVNLPTPLGDRLIRRGEPVTLLLGSANRDPAAFPNPDQPDITRRPNRHLAFGRGIHYCLGAPLAITQGSIALRLLFERCSDWRLGQPPTWSDNFGFRGMTSLMIESY